MNVPEGQILLAASRQFCHALVSMRIVPPGRTALSTKSKVPTWLVRVVGEVMSVDWVLEAVNWEACSISVSDRGLLVTVFVSVLLTKIPTSFLIV